jgi:hypothetical protein
MPLAALQPQPGPKATPRSTEWCEIGRKALGKVLSCCTSNRVFRDTSALNHVSEQNSCRSCPQASRIDTDLRLWGGLGTNAVNGRHSTSPRTVCLVRAEGKDPLDKLVTAVLMKDHCECTAGLRTNSLSHFDVPPKVVLFHFFRQILPLCPFLLCNWLTNFRRLNRS